MSNKFCKIRKENVEKGTVPNKLRKDLGNIFIAV
jgi:hypothetical protein